MLRCYMLYVLNDGSLEQVRAIFSPMNSGSIGDVHTDCERQTFLI